MCSSTKNKRENQKINFEHIFEKKNQQKNFSYNVNSEIQVKGSKFFSFLYKILPFLVH